MKHEFVVPYAGLQGTGRVQPRWCKCTMQKLSCRPPQTHSLTLSLSLPLCCYYYSPLHSPQPPMIASPIMLTLLCLPSPSHAPCTRTPCIVHIYTRTHARTNALLTTLMQCKVQYSPSSLGRLVMHRIYETRYILVYVLFLWHITIYYSMLGHNVAHKSTFAGHSIRVT